jgi:hypothetical protein
MSNFPLGDGVQTPEATVALEQIRDRLGYPDTTGRLRVALESISGSLTLSTITTVGTVTNVGTVGGVTNLAQVGSLLANYDQVAAFNTMPAMNRNQIAVS